MHIEWLAAFAAELVKDIVVEATKQYGATLA